MTIVRPHLIASIMAALLLLGASVLVNGQEPLTPEQSRILNQLPPAQRQQALDALRRMQGKTDAGSTQSSISEALTPSNATAAAGDVEPLNEVAELHASPGSRIVINLIRKHLLTGAQLEQLADDPVLSRIQGSHVYELDSSGILRLPGLADIPLLGLTNEAITQRLGAEPSLGLFDVTAVLLDLQPIGTEALKPFGYELFQADEIGFEPYASGPVPADYVLGPGDSVRVQLFGNVNGIYEYEVTRDGMLNLPELGPVTVAGLPFADFRADLDKRVQQTLIGTQVSVTMGQLRTIRVFVLGDANRPGSYVVGSLATISTALYRSGGISGIGSLRTIQLKRRGTVVGRLDLYDLLLNGDTSADLRLQPGDVIFVPPIGDTVAVAGAVRRPAIYELRGRATVADALRLAGGLQADAYASGARLERISGDSKRVVISVDAGSASGAGVKLSGGDTLTIPEVLPDTYASVSLSGHVQRPGPYEWRPGMRLTELIPTARDLMPGADVNYILIRRESPADRSIQVLSANLNAALADPRSAENLRLQERDTVYVFSLALGRQRVIAPILEELRLQAQFGIPYNEVQVVGQVRAPGSYPLEPGMRISDLIRAGSGMAEGAYALDAELARYTVVNDEYRATEIIDVDMNAIVNGDASSDLPLSAHDRLKISLLPEWMSDWSVSVEGEVRFPGTFQVRRGESLRDVIQRAGGLTDHAFPEGAVFLRESLKERERQQIDVLIHRMESDLAALSLESLDTSSAEALSAGQALLDQLRNIEPVGRLVIDVTELSSGRSGITVANNIELQDGDRLLMPTKSQAVTVLGETQYTTSHLFQPGLKRDDYIAQSGGLTRKADKRQIYIVRASGVVVSPNRSRWFGRGGNVDIRPGDTIVVPLDTDRIRPLTFWTNATQILYQGAIAIAAIRSFDK